MQSLLLERCFKRRTSDATKIRRFFHLCKYFHIVLIISHLSVPLIFNVKSKNNVSKNVRLLKHCFSSFRLYLSVSAFQVHRPLSRSSKQAKTPTNTAFDRIKYIFQKILFINYLDKQKEDITFVPKDVRFLKHKYFNTTLIINDI